MLKDKKHKEAQDIQQKTSNKILESKDTQKNNNAHIKNMEIQLEQFET